MFKGARHLPDGSSESVPHAAADARLIGQTRPLSTHVRSTLPTNGAVGPVERPKAAAQRS